MNRTMKLVVIALVFAWAGLMMSNEANLMAQPPQSRTKGEVEQLTLPDYRQWTHVKSMVIFDEKHPLYKSFGGMHHIYVNAKGLKASQAGGPYPDGSTLVFVLYEAENKGGAYVAGKKKVEAIMVKDRRRFAETGGWGFQAFDPQTHQPLIKQADVKSACYNCHASVKDRDYVFSRFVK